MAQAIRRIGVIGDGGWGTTLALHLAHKKHEVVLWSAFPEYAAQVQKTRENSKFLPGFKIPRNVYVTNDLQDAIEGSQLILLAAPSQFLRSVLLKIKPLNYRNKIFLSVVKGIEHGTLKRMSQVIEEVLGKVPLAVLSGPTIASEVARGIPTTAVIASSSPARSAQLQKIINSPEFRIYTNNDIVGVELGGSVKNVIAVACGVCDGLGFGTNTKAAILTRGLAEMARLGKALGAKSETFYGLTGLGDLVTTCVNEKSRNRSAGEAIGKGKNMRAVLGEMVAEGVATAEAVYHLSRRYKVKMPITQQVYEIVYKGKSAKKAVADLMSRALKAE